MTVVDLGDVAIRGDGSDHAAIVAVAGQAARAGPLLAVGGDHSVTFPLVEGLAAVHGPLNLLHFDGASPGSLSRLRRQPALTREPVRQDHGTRPRQEARPGRCAHLEQAQSRAGAAVRYVEVVEWADFTPASVPIPTGPLYVMIDLDAIDPAFAPGVSHPEPAGLSVRDIVAVIARIRTHVVGADVVELNPAHDTGDATAIVAVKLIKELMGAMARR